MRITHILSPDVIFGNFCYSVTLASIIVGQVWYIESKHLQIHGVQLEITVSSYFYNICKIENISEEICNVTKSIFSIKGHSFPAVVLEIIM